MPRRSKRIKTARQSGGKFGNLPRKIVVDILKFFDIHEVARLQRFVCREFRDAGQERIHERGGRKLYEEGRAFMGGEYHQIIDTQRGELLLQAARGAGCRTEDLKRRMYASNPSDEEKQKILKELKEIARSSPYHWVDFLIGKWYHNGWGGEQNKKQAVVFYTKAKNSGNVGAIVNLGLAYQTGDLGLTKSLTKAYELYSVAADKGDALARHNLSKLYQCGSKDGPPLTVPVDDDLAFKWMLAAAEQGHADSMNHIGIHCENGTCSASFILQTGGLDRNLGTAFEWFMKSAVEGNQHGQYNVGSYYENGKGTTTVDLLQALHWFQKAAAQENSQAQFSVGFFFEYGRGGIPIDLEQALHWYEKAAAQENTRAMEAVARLSS